MNIEPARRLASHQGPGTSAAAHRLNAETSVSSPGAVQVLFRRFPLMIPEFPQFPRSLRRCRGRR